MSTLNGSSIIVFPHENGFNWLVSTPQGTRRGHATLQSDAWTLAKHAHEALNG